MLASIDLTQRQAARVLEQALRTRAQVEIEPRSAEGTISGTLSSRHEGLLCVDLHDLGQDWPLAGLIGAFCEVKMALSGQMYVFTTCILDTVEGGVPQRLHLAPPDVVQVSNRRCFERVSPPQEVPVQLWPAGVAQPAVGVLKDISPTGLRCSLVRREVDQLLLIDDEVRISFQLPEAGEAFTLSAIVCVKTPAANGEYLDVGLEFAGSSADEAPDSVLGRLRTALSRWYASDPQMGGGE